MPQHHAPRAEPRSPLIPRRVLFDNPETANPQISPDGQRVAFLRADDAGVMQGWVQSLHGEARQITRDQSRGVHRISWTPDGEALLYLQDSDGDEIDHLFYAPLDGSKATDLTPFPGARVAQLVLRPDAPHDLIVIMNRRDRALFEPWRLHLPTGTLALAAENPGDVTQWIADRRLAVRGAVRRAPTGGGELLVRDADGAPWKAVCSFDLEDDFSVVGFSEDGRAAHVLTNIGADTAGLYAVDAKTAERTLLASAPGADVERALVHPRTQRVQAVSFARARRWWVALDDEVAGDLQAIAPLVRGDFEITSRDRDDRAWLICDTSDAAPLHYHVWDRTTRRLTTLFSARPKLSAYELAPMQPFELRARDGLSLPSYLTLPPGAPPKGLPLVLYVHGGPWDRDVWGYEPNAQWLANRGHAVLQVNYRGSIGFGKAFKNAARKQFAGQMHDDLVDAVRWAIEQGIADPARVAIFGSSYGGYAVLVGLTRSPELFACGVAFAAPSNLVTLVESFPPYWGPYLSSTWYPFVGDPRRPADRADMLARSPLFEVDRIRAPLLIAQGENDPRVPRAESDRLVEALRQQGKVVEHMLFAAEGHSLVRPESRLAFAAAVEAFLARHLGTRCEPADSAGDRA